MKIKQVCQLTGLTPRTVRFYCERGLITPTVYTTNARNCYVFSEEDVLALRRISALRQADFSLEEIASMMEDPQSVGETVCRHSALLQRQMERITHVLHCLQALESAALADFNALADRLQACLNVETYNR